MTKDEALKLALEALDGGAFGKELERVVIAIREALAEQPENQVDDINVVDIPAQQCQHAWKNISSKRQTVYQCELCGIYTFEQPVQQDPVQTTPNSEQLKQILDGLDRCIHRDSKQEFLRTWIRDWTEHKLAKQTLSTRHQGETK